MEAKRTSQHDDQAQRRRGESLHRQTETIDSRRDEDEDLTEVAAPAPVQDEDSSGWRRQVYVESALAEGGTSEKALGQQESYTSRPQTQLYTISYLVFFSIMGTLARLGLQRLTFYPGAPVALGVLWANFAGSLVMGFLAQDRRLFQEEWGIRIESRKSNVVDESSDTVAAMRKHGKVKKTIPLYIGLATGFCGSFTSFSSFIRDVFLALSNDLPTPISHPYPSSAAVSASLTVPRNGGYSFMASFAVIILTVCLSLGALKIGAHIALALDPITPTLPFRFTRKIIDPSFVFLAWGSWLGVVFMAVWPPDRPQGPDSRRSWENETWRGQAIFAICFAPLGCLLRFYASLKLNAIVPSFPLGTFAVNIFGTAVLGMAFDIQHVPLNSLGDANGGGRVGCQVLQGIIDGFCGCLTTVSTWVAELDGLKRRHAWTYGTLSVSIALALLVVIMGSVRWTVGFSTPACVT